MASSYRGLYVQKTSDGLIHNAQVVDTGGNSIPLDPELYIQRDVKPPINELPELSEYKLLVEISQTGSAPAPESEQHRNLIKNGYLRRMTRTIENSPGEKAIVGHELTDKGRALIK